MMFVLVREADGAYVARPDGDESYTFDLKNAQLFKSKLDAEENCGIYEKVLGLAEAKNRHE